MADLDHLAEINRVPEGEWIILSSDQLRLVAHHPDLRKALAVAEEKGEKDTVIMRAGAAGKSLIIAC